MTVSRDRDTSLRERADKVIPGGMYGHLSARRLSPNYPQFYARVQGARAWDVDGREFVDMMCSFGPMILGYQHEKVEQAAAAQRSQGDTQPGPGEAMVELAEILTDRVDHADWAMFGKNGSDATRLCLSAARATTGRRHVVASEHSYHGWLGWSNRLADGHAGRPDPETFRYTYNDLDSVRAAVEQADAGKVAAIFVSPFRHDAGHDQELVDHEFAKGVRALCDEIGAALVMDEVRAGFRLHHGSSWEPLGVKPDLSAWSKAIANGYPIAAALGSDRYREGVEQVFATGSFWYQAVPMAAAIATIRALKDENAIAKMEAAGTRLRDGIAMQAEMYSVAVCQTGPVQIPNLSFAGDADFAKAMAFCGEAAAHGAILHPRHNWFLSSAHTDADVDRVLEATDSAFRAVRAAFGSD
ncbi:MAG TPA: aminotransferase class III-fold pyridoxal phosphate-dependent enzyme [Streptosporangiaceae bacterium]|nr:aminotransferase class III-fold pyridoxal phosphate-dependent enzyme [Streptosporangiaceae bacterium]